MRILLLNDFLYPSFIGGVERRNADLAVALARRGHEVTLIGFGEGPARPEPGVRYESLGPLGKLYDARGKRRTMQSLRFAARAWTLDLSRFDLVETASVPYIHLVPLALRCRLRGIPLVVTWYEFWGPYWASYLGGFRAPVYRAIEGFVARLGTRIVATSRLTARRLEKHLPRRRPVAVVPCGVHLDEVRAAAPSEGARESDIVFAGRMIAEKRIDLLLEAAALLPEARVVVYGEGPDEKRLMAIAARLGVETRVDFRGHVEEATPVWREIARSKIAVQPSSREGFGIFPLEAMALGTPVVFVDWPDSAIPELVRDGVEGVMSAPDPSSLARALKSLLGDAGRRSAMGEAGRRRASEYDWPRVAERLDEIFSGLVASPGSASRDEREGEIAAGREERPSGR